jgi:hypothetical protein
MFPSCKHIELGTKPLKPGEFRTGFVHFDDVNAAIFERVRAN